VLRAFDEYLRFGGFPEVANAADERAKGKTLQTYSDTTFYRDVLAAPPRIAFRISSNSRKISRRASSKMPSER
jgi:predicted AAA+ superfamily ATPase